MSDASQVPPDGFLSDEMYRLWEQGMTSWWDQALSSSAFRSHLGENLANQRRARDQYERSVDETLSRMHLPTRSDLTRLARIATLLEERLLQQEDTLLAMKAQLSQLEKEALHARIEATEARIEAREAQADMSARLRALQARLAILENGTLENDA